VAKIRIAVPLNPLFSQVILSLKFFYFEINNQKNQQLNNIFKISPPKGPVPTAGQERVGSPSQISPRFRPGGRNQGRMRAGKWKFTWTSDPADGPKGETI
jgi:hypothetical protein